MSRWENAPTTLKPARMMRRIVGIYCASSPKPPPAVTLDIQDTCDVVHGYQQLSFWNGHYDERCFLPIQMYDTATGRPVAMLLRTGKTPTGKEAAGHIRRLVRQIRRHWPDTHITIRGDGHNGRPEVMDWCGASCIDYLLGPTGNAVPRGDTVLAIAADNCAIWRAEKELPDLRCHVETRYAAKRWKRDGRVVTRIEASRAGMDIRYEATSLNEPTAEHIYEKHYCPRGQAKNLIKMHSAGEG